VASNRRVSELLQQFTVSIWVNGMPVQTTAQAGDAPVVAESKSQRTAGRKAAWKALVDATVLTKAAVLVVSGAILFTDVFSFLRTHLVGDFYTYTKWLAYIVGGFLTLFVVLRSDLVVKKNRLMHITWTSPKSAFCSG